MTIDEFRRVDLRVGKILSAGAVPGSQKLLKLEVDIGTEIRQVVAGISQSYEPETLAGKQIIVVCNLEPREIMGLASQGMLLAVDDETGKTTLLTVDGEVAPGAQIS